MRINRPAPTSSTTPSATSAATISRRGQLRAPPATDGAARLDERAAQIDAAGLQRRQQAERDAGQQRERRW